MKQFAIMHEIQEDHLDHLDHSNKLLNSCKGTNKSIKKLKPQCPEKELDFSITGNEEYQLQWDSKNIVRNETEFCIDYNYGPDVAYVQVCLDTGKVYYR